MYFFFSLTLFSVSISWFAQAQCIERCNASMMIIVMTVATPIRMTLYSTNYGANAFSGAFNSNWLARCCSSLSFIKLFIHFVHFYSSGIFLCEYKTRTRERQKDMKHKNENIQKEFSFERILPKSQHPMHECTKRNFTPDRFRQQNEREKKTDESLFGKSRLALVAAHRLHFPSRKKKMHAHNDISSRPKQPLKCNAFIAFDDANAVREQM